MSASENIAKLFPNLTWRHPAGCLTLYLAAGPGYDPSYYRALLKDAEKRITENAERGRSLRVKVEIEAVSRFLDDVRPPGLPLAIFSCVPDGLFEALRLPEDVRSLADFGESCRLGPLVEQLERHPAAVAVVVEKDSADLYAVVLEDVHELGEFQGQHVSDTKRAGPSSSRHREEEHIRLNIKEAVDLLIGSGVRELGLEDLYLAGPVESRSAFKKLLPEPLRQRVKGELEVPVKLPPAELADRIRKLT